MILLRKGGKLSKIGWQQLHPGCSHAFQSSKAKLGLEASNSGPSRQQHYFKSYSSQTVVCQSVPNRRFEIHVQSSNVNQNEYSKLFKMNIQYQALPTRLAKMR